MKSLKILAFFAVIAAVAGSMTTACNHAGHSHDAATDQTTQTGTAAQDATVAPHGEGPEYTSAYVCPMHCPGSGSDKPGTCPACEMDYVAMTDHVKDGHHHDGTGEHSHEGHSH